MQRIASDAEPPRSDRARGFTRSRVGLARTVRQHPFGAAAAAFVTVAIVLFGIVACLSNAALPRTYRAGVKPAHYDGPAAFEGWVRYDAGWYRSIADNGYDNYQGDAKQSSVAFFPSYAIVMRVVHDVSGADTAAGGIAITFACGLASAVLFQRWCRQRLPAGSATTAVLSMLLWPYGFYLYGAVYADALFLAAALGAFVLVEADRPLAAGLLGLVASAARPVGLAVVIGLVGVQLQRGGWPLIRRSRWRNGSVLMSAGGFGGYLLYSWRHVGTPIAFIHAEGAPGWDQKAHWHTWLKVDFWDRIARFPRGDGVYTAGIVVQAVLGILLLVLAYAVFRRFGWGYALYVLAVLLPPVIGSKDFQGMGRYALAAFPSIAIIGAVLEKRPRVRAVVFATSALAMCVLTAAYASGTYVA